MSKKVYVVYYKKCTSFHLSSRWHFCQFFGSKEGALRFRKFAASTYSDNVFRVVSYDLLTLDDAKTMISFGLTPFPSCDGNDVFPVVDALLRP